MGKMSDIQQQATEHIDGMVGTSEVPDYVYEDAIIAEAKRIIGGRKDKLDTLEAKQLQALADLTKGSQEKDCEA